MALTWFVVKGFIKLIELNRRLVECIAHLYSFLLHYIQIYNFFLKLIFEVVFMSIFPSGHIFISSTLHRSNNSKIICINVVTFSKSCAFTS